MDKTREKMRRGGLPAPTAHTQITGRGDGRPCDGCGETIHPSETRVVVSIMATLQWRFHDGCFEAWVTYPD
jgi:hypothetical protein